MPEEKAEFEKYQFTPTEDFYSEQFKSQYLVGLNYTVRDQDSPLHTAVQEWLEQGSVVLGVAESVVDGKTTSSVKGKGEVS